MGVSDVCTCEVLLQKKLLCIGGSYQLRISSKLRSDGKDGSGTSTVLCRGLDLLSITPAPQISYI